MDWYIFLTPLLLLPILFLFRLVGCTQDFDQFEGDGRDYGDEGDDGPDRLPTYNFTAPSPSTGEMGVASKDFTVSLPSGQTVPASLTVTPDDGGKGGDFSEQSILLTPGVSPSATFTYTPHSVGKITISTANDHEDEGVKNPPSLTYDSTAPLINITFKLKIVDSIPL